MNSQRFWRSAAIQGAQVGVLFLILALALDEEFFEDYGFVVGPVIWIGCSLVTGRILRLPLGFTAVCARAGGVAGIVVERAAPPAAAIVAAVAVFAASASGYDDTAEPDGQASTP